MVNNYMKELCGAGLLEYRRKSLKSVSYHLTSAGAEQVTALEQELVCELTELFGQTKERVRKLIATHASGTVHRVVLYGTGSLAELAYLALESSGVEIVAVCDSDPAIIGHDWCGREVVHFRQIRFIAPDSVIIAVHGRMDEVYNSLRHLQDRGIHLIRLDGLDGSMGFNTPALTAHEAPDYQAV